MSSTFAVGPHFQLYSSSKIAEKFLEYTPNDRINFLVGTMFPEIWIISKNREFPTFEPYTIQNLHDEKDPFKRGVLFYHMLNSIEERVVKKLKYESNFPNGISRDWLVVLKNMIEDIYVYEETQEMSREVLENILHSNLHAKPEILGYRQHDILHWYMGISSYFLTRPHDTLNFIRSNYFHSTQLNLDLCEDFKQKLDRITVDQCIKSDHTKRFIHELKQELIKLCEEYDKLCTKVD